jgi:hypothetical protein
MLNRKIINKNIKLRGKIIVIWEENFLEINLNLTWNKIINWYTKCQPSDKSCKFHDQIN